MQASNWLLRRYFYIWKTLNRLNLEERKREKKLREKRKFYPLCKSLLDVSVCFNDAFDLQYGVHCWYLHCYLCLCFNDAFDLQYGVGTYMVTCACVSAMRLTCSMALVSCAWRKALAWAWTLQMPPSSMTPMSPHRRLQMMVSPCCDLLCSHGISQWHPLSIHWVLWLRNRPYFHTHVQN